MIDRDLLTQVQLDSKPVFHYPRGREPQKRGGCLVFGPPRVHEPGVWQRQASPWRREEHLGTQERWSLCGGAGTVLGRATFCDSALREWCGLPKDTAET